MAGTTYLSTINNNNTTIYALSWYIPTLWLVNTNFKTLHYTLWPHSQNKMSGHQLQQH